MRLIDADALRNELYDADAITMRGVAIINQAPTIDAVEVVRCGLCRYCDTKDCPMSGTPGSVSVSDFCSYGERT